MKSTFRLYMWLIGFALIAACSSTKQLSSGMTVAKNDTFDYTISQDTDMKISIMGQDMSTSGKQVTDYAFTIKEVMPNGDFKSDVTIKRVAFNQKAPMVGEMVYDSSDPEKNSNPMLKSLGETVGKTFILSYDKQGKITKTEGVDKIVGDLAKGLDGQAGQQIVTQMGAAGITNTLKNLSGILQDNPKVGGSWQVKSINRGFVDMDMDQTFTLRERKDGRAIIDVTGTAKSISGDEGLSFQGMEIGYDLEGPISGTVIVEEATGWAISSNIVPDLKGKMTLKGGPLGEMSVDASVKMGISATRK